jgi:alcohol dehydrogenase class IV
MDSFIYTNTPSRVIFGRGKVSTLPSEAEKLGVSKCLILCTKFQTKEAEMLKSLLGSKAVGIFDDATMHTPLSITTEALSLAKELQADSVISIGGGSTIGLGKAIAFKTGMPHICIPTTYAGSEMTPILGQTVDGKKTTESHPDIKPDVVIYDVDLTLTLPVGLSMTSSVNAIAHAGMFLPLPYPLFTSLVAC